MSLSTDDVVRIAKLARIRVDASELAEVQTQLNAIFTLMMTLQAVDTKGVVPMSHPQDLHLRLRPDVVSEHDQREAYQAIAPKVAEGLYLVPQVIE